MRGMRRVGMATALLTDEEINYIDEKVVETIRPLLIGRTLFPLAPVGDAGYRIVTFYTEGDMSAAVIDMEGQQESMDRAPLAPHTVTVPVLHKETRLFWRDIARQRRIGQPLDVAQAKNAGRRVGELEDLLLLTGDHTGVNFLGVEGLATATGRLASAAGAKDWVDAGTTYNCIGYVSAAIEALEGEGHYGPYKLILPPAFRAELRVAHPDLKQWLFQSIGDLLGGVENILATPNLKAADGVADSALVVEPGEGNWDLIIGEDAHSRQHEEKEGNIWLQVREVVAPRIKRPKAIYEITELT